MKSVVNTYCSAPPRLRVRFFLSDLRHYVYAQNAPQSPFCPPSFPAEYRGLRQTSRRERAPNVAKKLELCAQELELGPAESNLGAPELNRQPKSAKKVMMPCRKCQHGRLRCPPAPALHRFFNVTKWNRMARRGGWGAACGREGRKWKVDSRATIHGLRPSLSFLLSTSAVSSSLAQRVPNATECNRGGGGGLKWAMRA